MNIIDGTGRFSLLVGNKQLVKATWQEHQQVRENSQGMLTISDTVTVNDPRWSGTLETTIRLIPYTVVDCKEPEAWNLAQLDDMDFNALQSSLGDAWHRLLHQFGTDQ